VLDADALNAVAANADLRAALRERALRGQATVLTPHPLEAARLLDVGASTVQADRQGAAAALVERYACAVVLKGSGSVMAAPGVVPRINPSGNAALSTPGTGDVLAGWLAGWWSRLAREGAVQPALGAASVTASATAAPEASGAMLPAAASNAPPWATAVHDVCAYAVWTHGRAAELASPEGQALPAADLVQVLGIRARSGCW
jgi:NAD(P)H-hydrate repair Nnr-like enzyme with NAD(P)H-hydrate dehydratase domain